MYLSADKTAVRLGSLIFGFFFAVLIFEFLLFYACMLLFPCFVLCLYVVISMLCDLKESSTIELVIHIA